MTSSLLHLWPELPSFTLPPKLAANIFRTHVCTFPFLSSLPSIVTMHSSSLQDVHCLFLVLKVMALFK